MHNDFSGTGIKIIPRGLWLTRDDGVLLFLVLFQQIGR